MRQPPDSATVEELIAEAREAGTRAYAPYSGFKVGAAARGASGRTYLGCNVENASYGLTICAERVALAAAVAAGEKELLAVALYAPSPVPVSPCGACRQVLLELAPTATVIMANADQTRAACVADLLPTPFGREDLAASGMHG